MVSGADETVPAVLVPEVTVAGASAAAAAAATAAPAAGTPSSVADQLANGSVRQPSWRPPSREGSGRHAITITADGSGRGGRAFFETVPGGSRPSSRSDASRDTRWHQAVAEESALEAHSLQHRPHPAAAAGKGVTAGQAALRELQGGVAAQNGQLREYTAVWLVEDGNPRTQPSPGPHSSTGGGSGDPPPAAEGKQPSGGDASVKGGSSIGGRGKDGFANAVVMIEEPGTRKYFDWAAYWGSLPKKLKGGLDTRLPVPTFREIFWAWLGAFLGILAVCAMNQWVTPEIDIAFVVGSFGASAVLVFALLESKMSQPRNFLGGQMLSALVGITTRVIIHQTWIAGPVGMSLALVVMQLTATTHPPGGATALIAATLPTLPKWHGYSYLVTIGVGSCIMQIIALVVNNIDPSRRYPTYWY